MLQSIKERKSVRTFNKKKLEIKDKETFQDCLDKITNPFGIEVNFQLLDAKEHNLSAPVIVGEDTYLIGKVKRVENFELAYGYSLEKACLDATSLGLGSVMLAGTLKRELFEKAINLQEDEVMPAVSPIGYPAQKKSIRESLMRKGMKSDQRLEFGTLFFEGDFNHPITKENSWTSILEAVQWAPSATNQQPWRIVVDKDCVHFYKKQSIPTSLIGDIQKVDMGIALCHFDLERQEKGIQGSFIKTDHPESEYEYIITFKKDS